MNQDLISFLLFQLGEVINLKIPLSIILIEDNLADIELFKYILKDFEYPYQFIPINQFEQAKSFISDLQNFTEHSQKRIFFIDLNLRSMDGLQLLEQLKKNPKTSAIPIIITTTSESDKDIYNVYRNYANCYLLKSPEFDDYHQKIIKALEFWTETCILPDT